MSVPTTQKQTDDVFIVKSRSSDTVSGGVLDDEDSAVLLLGCIQVALGVLMAACGVLTLVHEAALSQVGGGLWGGAVAMCAGVVGVLAGVRGCNGHDQGPKPPATMPPVASTAFLALCLLAIAVSNLVGVLAATGLVRDVQRPQHTQDGAVDWGAVLPNFGLLVTSVLHCVSAAAAVHRCWRTVCVCMSRRTHSAGSEDSLEGGGSSCSSSSRDRLIGGWRGRRHGDMVVVGGRHMPGHIFTLPHQSPLLPIIPPSVISCHLPGPQYISPLAQSQYLLRRPLAEEVIRQHHMAMTHSKRRSSSEERRQRRKNRDSKHSRSKSSENRPVTEEDVAKTYTGLDREIAEEFIAIAMEPGAGKERQARRVD